MFLLLGSFCNRSYRVVLPTSVLEKRDTVRLAYLLFPDMWRNNFVEIVKVSPSLETAPIISLLPGSRWRATDQCGGPSILCILLGLFAFPLALNFRRLPFHNETGANTVGSEEMTSASPVELTYIWKDLVKVGSANRGTSSLRRCWDLPKLKFGKSMHFQGT